jgi:hypothetical protein
MIDPDPRRFGTPAQRQRRADALKRRWQELPESDKAAFRMKISAAMKAHQLRSEYQVQPAADVTGVCARFLRGYNFRAID